MDKYINFGMYNSIEYDAIIWGQKKYYIICTHTHTHTHTPTYTDIFAWNYFTFDTNKICLKK